jgi:hypothetical protein
LRELADADEVGADLEGVLDHELAEIQRATENGTPARNLVVAFRRTIEAHRGKGLTDSAADTLDDLAQRLIARVPA